MSVSDAASRRPGLRGYLARPDRRTFWDIFDPRRRQQNADAVTVYNARRGERRPPTNGSYARTPSTLGPTPSEGAGAERSQCVSAAIAILQQPGDLLACRTCPDYQTTPAFLPVHRQHADNARVLIAPADASGHFRLAANHRRVVDSLERIIPPLEVGQEAGGAR